MYWYKTLKFVLPSPELKLFLKNNSRISTYKYKEIADFFNILTGTQWTDWYYTCQFSIKKVVAKFLIEMIKRDLRHFMYKNGTWVFACNKFWSIPLEHFFESKPFIFDEWRSMVELLPFCCSKLRMFKDFLKNSSEDRNLLCKRTTTPSVKSDLKTF